jgi:hypothetical protein
MVIVSKRNYKAIKKLINQQKASGQESSLAESEAV